MSKQSSAKRITAALLATSMAVSAYALSPTASNILALPKAYAEAVKIDAPRAPGFADVVEAVSPAVVSVRVEQEFNPAANRGEFRFDRRFYGDEDLPEFFKRFFDDFEDFDDRGRRDGRRGDKRRGDERRDERPRRPHRFGASSGSGFFISKDGYVVTNNHVVDGGAKFTIVMNDGTELPAELVGADQRSDLAVLKVDDKADEKRDFTYVSFSDADPRIGDWVVAVGNPFGLGGTVTAGIVSARGREIGVSRYNDFIQIDAAVNKGNSGGPAFDLSGEVIGVNTAIFSPSGGNVGIAFAIPASIASEVVDELIDNGSVVRGWLGVRIQPVNRDIAEALDLDEAQGALVSEPQEGSPAAKAGIKAGDVIVAVDGKKVRGPRGLARMIGGYDPEAEVDISVVRDGETEDVTVTLGKLDTSERIDGPTPQTTIPRKLGMALKSTEDGVVVVEVEPGSPADRKGIRSGDIVAGVNGEEVDSPADVARIIEQVGEDGRKSALLQIRRDESTRFVAIPFERG